MNRLFALAAWSAAGCLITGAGTAPEPAPSEARPAVHAGKPAVRLYAIASSANGKCTEEDLRVLAEQFQMVYGGFSREQMDAMRRINPAFKVLQYVGTFSTNTSSKLLPAPEAEKRRGELLHYLAAQLAEDAPADSTTIRLQPISDRIPVVLKPSTAKGDYTSGDANAPAVRNYVTWIRIGAEFMRVNGFEPKTGEAAVERGFAGSAAAAHKAGAPVLHPVYLEGECPGIEKNDYGRPARNIAYIPDPAAPLRWDLTYEETLASLEKGYDGIWIDCLGSRPFNPVDVANQKLGREGVAKQSAEDLLAGGSSSARALWLWNFAANQPYSDETFRVCCEKGITRLQDRLKERLGKLPVLYANNIGPGYFPDQGGRKLFLMPTDAKPRPLDGFCLECFAGTMSNTSFSLWYYDNGPAAPPTPHNEERWKYAVRVVMDACQSQLAICPMMHQAGWKTQMHEALSLADRDKFEMFAYASYLMAMEKGAPSMLGLPAFYVTDKGRFAWLHDRFFWPIGEPAETRRPDDLDSYRLAGHKTFARRFTNGLVLVNPTADADADVRLDRSYRDPETAQAVSVVTLPPSSGKILLQTGPKDKDP